MRTDREFSLRLLGHALKAGVTQAEVYQSASRTLSVEVKSGEVEAMESAVGYGYGLRVIKDGRLGFSYSTDRAEAGRVVETALETSGFSEHDGFLDLPEPVKPGTPEIYDTEVASVKDDEAVEKACLIERAALSEDKRVKKIRKASASFSLNDTLIVNSKGVSYGCASTFCTAHIMCTAEEGGDNRMGWDFQAGRFLSDVKFDRVGSDAARRALEMLGARRITATKSPVVLDRLVAAEFLSVLASMLSSEAVQKGKSLLKGRIGQKVISGTVDIIDNGLMPRASGTRHIDDEGVPVAENVLIKEGVLQGLMYNTHTARKDNVKSTGNAVRRGLSTVPSVGPINLYTGSSEKRLTLKAMFGSMDRGLYVTEAMGVHTANPVSGEFSIGVSGLWVEGGEVRFPVKEAVISGNMLEFFGRVQAAGDDLRFYGNIGSPCLLVGPTDISA